MTTIKQKAVETERHAKNVRDYINSPKAIMRDFQNISDKNRWAYEMDVTREVSGHNQAARDGAKNTLMYHQCLNFLPDECDMNGGKMTPELCMQYAKEYAATRYPHQQIAFALHRERSKETKVERYTVHMAINRTNTETRKRLAEGRGETAKRDRAKFVRGMDQKWGLQQVQEGVQNSKIHPRQPSRIGAERAIIDRAAGRGIEPQKASYKYNLRELCKVLQTEAKDLDEYRALLDKYGVATEIKGRRLFVTDKDNARYSFLLSRLDRSLTANALQVVFRRNSGDQDILRIEQEFAAFGKTLTDYTELRTKYISAVKTRVADYDKAVKQTKTKPDDFPKFKIPRIPAELKSDTSLSREILNYTRRADKLRGELLKDPAAIKKSRSSERTAAADRTPDSRAPETTRTRNDVR